ncbi:MAG TPA: LTA synthase family protein [Bacilli bacterium]|nr:LTA synthase family protein [Bacilli bacterium]
MAGMLLPKKNDQEESFSFIGRLLILITLSLIPAVHYAKINSDYLIGSFKYVFFLLIPLIAFINYILSWQISGHKESKSIIAIRSGIFSLLLIALPIIRFSLRITSKVDMDFWALLFVLLLLSYFIHSRKRTQKFLQFSGIILFVFIISGFFGEKTPPGALYPRKKLTPEMKSITFKEKPNIYLFVYDGIPNERVFTDQDLSFDKLKSLLDDYEFTLYEDTYSLGNASLNSMGKMLDFTDRDIKGPEGRDIYAGNSWTNLILRNNGYKSRFLLDNYYVGHSAVTHTELFDEMYPIRTASSTQIDYFSVLMRGILQGEMRFDTRGLLDVDEADVQKRKHEIIQEEKNSFFVVNHYELPGHSQNSGKCLPNETELWIKNLDIALELIERDFDLIEKHDPNSIVIAIGDHGPSLLGDCYDLAAWKKEEITPDLMWDRIGTLVAIRWPDERKAAKFDGALVTNQDVFPVIFSYLADESDYLKHCPNKVFWGYATPTRSEIGFDRGNIVLDK